MKASILSKLQAAAERLQEINAHLSDPAVIGNQNKFRDLSREYAQLNPVVACFEKYNAAVQRMESARAILEENDAEMRALGQEDLEQAQKLRDDLELELQTLLLPRDPNDDKNIFLEIRAGTGGDEAALFAGDLLRMYTRYAESRRWNIEIISDHAGEHGGHKEVIVRIAGQGAYSRLKFESGGHRVQRVPQTEAQGRIHTSACTVAIMPEVEEIDAIDINPADLRIDTYRASGAGGQHVNKTDSAIRITHIPTGIVVECQDERSQHKNRARAMSLLQSRMLAAERARQDSEQAATRKSLIGSGDRSERIRTYNFPQGRMTDHRINLTLYKLDDVMNGALDQVIDPLTQEDQLQRLAEIGE